MRPFFNTLALLLLFIKITSCSPTQKLTNSLQEKYIGRGLAINTTVAKQSGIEILLIKTKKGYQATISWDNQTLFGDAFLTSKSITQGEATTLITFSGTFDCSNISGWPEDTFSNIEYHILGRDALPEQWGNLLMPIHQTN